MREFFFFFINMRELILNLLEIHYFQIIAEKKKCIGKKKISHTVTLRCFYPITLDIYGELQEHKGIRISTASFLDMVYL